MAKFYDSINEQQRAFIAAQHIFFVSTAPLSAGGHVNLSPKGLDSFRVLSPNRVGYMDIISSGNETSAHLLENGRITFMFCSFTGDPLILRLYGQGLTLLPDDPRWPEFSPHFTLLPSTRQLIIAVHQPGPDLLRLWRASLRLRSGAGPALQMGGKQRA